MAETKVNKIKEIIFFIAFLLSCFTMNSDNLAGYWYRQSTLFIFTRFFLIIFFLSIITLINKSNTAFISKAANTILLLITPLIIFDYYVTHISGSQFLYRVWWIAYTMVASATVFIVITLIKPKNYKNYYYSFFRSFTPIYLFTLYICFIRTPNTSLTTNFKLFNGTFLMLKAIIDNPHINFEAYLIFIGNIIIFLPLPLIISAIFKKSKSYQLLIIGFIMPFIVEGYQYIFKCGDVDIDDVILNWLGFFIGLIIHQAIKKRLLTESE